MPRPRLSDEVIAKIKKARRSMSLRKAAKFLGISKRTVQKYVPTESPRSDVQTPFLPYERVCDESYPLAVDGVRFAKIAAASRYAFGSDGSVWRKSRRGEWKQTVSPRITGRYRLMTLRHDDGTIQSELVHRLILTAFTGPPPQGMEACHWDDIKDNNVLTNLRWDTPKGNAADRIRNRKQGAENGRADHQTG